jgi:capsular exopolysaccharide synthesis family protein
MNKVDQNIWDGNVFKPELESNNNVKVVNPAFDIDFKRILGLWPFILLFGLLGYAVGVIYLRYITPIYTISTSISLEENQEVSLGQVLFGSNKDPLNDKIAYFKSPTLASQLIDSLGINYHAESQGRFKNKDYYGIIRWQILSAIESEIPEISFSILPKKNGFKFISGSISGDAKWSTPFKLKNVFVIVYKLKENVSSNPIFCYNQNKLTEAFKLSGGIMVTPSKESNVISVKYADISSERAIDILNGLIKLQNQVLEQDKSIGFSKAIDFIERRMDPLRRELDSIESSLAAFKASRGLSGSSTNGDLYLQKVQGYDNELTRITIMEATIKAVEDFIKNPSIKDADLAFVGIENSGLQNMCNQYQQMRIQRDKLALTAQETNPTLILMDKNLADLKGNMEKQLSSYKKNLQIAQYTYQGKINSANALLQNVPIVEKELMDKTRFQNIKEALYLTLLQKREEAYIAKASVNVNTKIIYPPLKSTAVIKPSKATILLTAILLGLLLPIIFAIVKEITNKKIISKKQLQNSTSIPVLAELEQVANTESYPFVIGGNNRSMFGEQIRSLRTNINFYLNPDKSTNYILLTSSVSGEGKSFLSMNIAKSYSIQGKKVALLEFDLRRPKISKALGYSDNEGLTSFLIGKKSIQEITIPIINDDKEHFDLFSAGTIPPNPQELLSTKYMEKLKKYLDETYEVVIIDTPPFGIVADAQILTSWADLTMIVTRFNQTVREQIQEINEWQARGVFKSLALIFNGVKNSGYFGYKYGYYYYKRKYGYGYYSSYIGNKKERKIY